MHRAAEPRTDWPLQRRWLRGRDLNPRPLGYEPNELPDCSTPRHRSRRGHLRPAEPSNCSTTSAVTSSSAPRHLRYITGQPLR